MSLIGTGSNFPLSWGNYFWLDGGPRVANFWWENLKEADSRFNLGGSVKIRRYKTVGNTSYRRSNDYCIIDDDRIPKDWYYNKLCFTGMFPPPLEVLRDMYSYLGDPDGELEKYENPKKYYTDRGHEYNELTGIITYRMKNTEPQTLTIPYKCSTETADSDAGFFYAPFTPQIKAPK